MLPKNSSWIKFWYYRCHEQTLVFSRIWKNLGVYGGYDNNNDVNAIVADNNNHDNNDVGDDADLNSWPALIRISPTASTVCDVPLQSCVMGM